ncbi:hypothetical protein WAF17_09955 [Bernardetia sp. ABR2-2B]|uniref:hypothetical protein n=1 Tax=Bernardetia sp. ABR2-2B TaxID=3127472 RepID=UPI0030CB69F8
MTFLFWFLFFIVSFLSVLTSIFFKNGQTIQIVLLPAIFFLVYFVFQSKKNIKRNYFFRDKNKVFILIFGSSLIWLFNAAFVFDISAIFEGGNNFTFLIPSKDSFFYGRLSEQLLSSKYETVFAFHEDSKAALGTTPYHYFELWLSAFFVKIFSVSGYIAYSLFTIPLLQICTWIGILAIYEQKNYFKLGFKVFLYSVGLLFLAGIYFPFYTEIKGFQSTYWLTNSIFTGLSEHYFFWIAVFLCFQNQNYRACSWVIFMIPIVSPTLWAACWTGLFFIGILLLHQQKLVFLKTYKLEIIAFFLIPLCYFLFYYFTKSFQSVVNIDISILVLSESNISLLGILKELTLYLFGFFVIYILFLILFYSEIIFFFRTFQKKSAILFFIGGVLGGVLFYILLPFHQERFQFLRNFILPFIQVSIIYFFITKQNYLNSKVKILFSFLLLYGFGFTLHWFWKETQPNQVYSQTYLNSIENKLIQKKELKRGAILHTSDYYDDKLLFNQNENFEIEGRYLAFKTSLEGFYNLDMVCIDYQNRATSSFSETDIFAVWLNKKLQNQILNEKMICDDSLKWLFVKEKKLDFVVIGKNVSIPSEIQSKIQFQVQDSKSGEVFLRLR